MTYIDLQWFAAEDEGRTFDPTEQKLRRARVEEGRVPKSQELSSSLGLLFPALTLLFLAPGMLNTCTEMIRFFFTRITELDPTRDGRIVRVFVRYFIQLAFPLLLVALVTGIFSHVVQSGFIFTTKPLTPKLDRIVPHFGQYLSKTIFSVNGIFNFVKSIIKMFIIGIAAFIIIKSDIPKILNLQRASLWQGVTTISVLAAKLLIMSAILLLILSVPDYLFQRWQFRQEMKMSRLEMQEERKQDEGDPLVKSHLRRRMQQLLSQNLRETVPRADVVITNPTHFAVALKYEAQKMDGPQVIAKGEDNTAQQIKNIARDNGVPIVENKPLARALYAQVEIGETVPKEFWNAVAAVLQKVMAINNERRRVRAEA
jgi:flagellar biosynthetic protein FlhB